LKRLFNKIICRIFLCDYDEPKNPDWAHFDVDEWVEHPDRYKVHYISTNCRRCDLKITRCFHSRKEVTDAT